MRRTVSRRVIRNAAAVGPLGAISGMGKDAGSTCFNSIGGFFFGALLFAFTFMLPFYAAKTEKDSKDVARLEVTPVADSVGKSGKFLLSGKAEPVSSLRVPRGSASGIIAFRYIVEEYVTRLETHTETDNGQQYQVTEEVTEWETNEDRSRREWSDIRFGPLTLSNSSPSLRIDMPWREIYRQGDEKTKLRETVEVIDGNVDCLLAVELENGLPAAEPDFYRLTNRSKDGLVAAMNVEEEGRRWGLIILSVILWTISMNLMAGPAMLMFNLVPVKQVGGCARSIVTFISFLIACVTAWLTYVLTRYWWLVILLLIGIVVWMMIQARRNALEPDPDMELEPEEPAGS